MLQATFLSNNCFEHLTRLIQNSKVGRARLRVDGLGPGGWGTTCGVLQASLGWTGLGVCGEWGGLRLGMALYPIGGACRGRTGAALAPCPSFPSPKSRGRRRAQLFLIQYLLLPAYLPPRTPLPGFVLSRARAALRSLTSLVPGGALCLGLRAHIAFSRGQSPGSCPRSCSNPPPPPIFLLFSLLCLFHLVPSPFPTAVPAGPGAP